jgi:energy-dependent translational throttle protein EttA
VYFYPGSWTEYDEDRKKRLGDEATPKRPRFRMIEA